MIKFENQTFVFELDKFSDGTKKITISQYSQLPENNAVVVVWKFENESEIVTLYYITSWFRENRPEVKLYLKLFYVPYSRMDRVESEEDVFTLKYFANLLNGMNFERVYILDPHSRVTPALINRAVVYDSSSYLETAIRNRDSSPKPLTLIFPDRGSYERFQSQPYKEVYKNNNVEQFLYGEKKREWKSSHITDFTINARGHVSLDDVMIVDDIITTGRTIAECLDALDNLGGVNGKIYVFSTFIENAAFKNEEFCRVLNECEKIFTTYALPFDRHPKIEVVR